MSSPPAPSSMASLRAELLAEFELVADHTAFATVDELHARMRDLTDRHPDVASIARVGTSRLGEKLWCLTIGAADAEVSTPAALVFAMPHPNEPIGALTALQLAQRLCEDARLRRSTGLVWHIVACIDPDGTRLNEGWFAGPFTRTHYGRNFYRPAGPEQVEWNFPFAYKDAFVDRVMPETLALMRLIDDTRPLLMCSLHNSELGGAYYYVSWDEPELFAQLQAIPQHLGIPLETGEPEASWSVPYADGIYPVLRREDTYDHAERLGLDPAADPSGATSTSYADRHGTYTLVCELPYWADDRSAVGDQPLGTSYAAALRRQAADMRELIGVLSNTLETVEDDLSVESPFIRATRFFAAFLPGIPADAEQRAAEAASERSATAAEQRSLRDVVHSCRVRYAGMLLRALEGELAIGNHAPAIRAAVASLAPRHADWCELAEAATAERPIPIRDLVASQLGAILATAWHLTAARP
ncbi:M14 family zinc carboxypeptidase [Egicoccus sp. AB-alg6-2]|uniref:M14 family zinc carboxypeptidase n=1 Tax=Egicoccus sp. AB-alg6-2 TaxID=3242692 RepID=UPI00359E1486